MSPLKPAFWISAREAVWATWLFLHLVGSQAAAGEVKPQPSKDQLAASVLLIGRQAGGIRQASGVIVDAERRWVLTSWHFWNDVEKPRALAPIVAAGKTLVAPTPYLNRYFEGKACTPEQIWSDPACDLALLAVDELRPISALAPTRSQPSEGDRLLALGNPQARNAMWQVSAGRLRRNEWKSWTYLSGQRVAAGMLEFDVDEPLSSGFSGGPVFNSKGELAGITIAAAKPDGSAVYAVDAARIRRFLARALIHEAIREASRGDRKGAARTADLAVAQDSADPLARLVRGAFRAGPKAALDFADDLNEAIHLSAGGKFVSLWLHSLRGAFSSSERDPLALQGPALLFTAW